MQGFMTIDSQKNSRGHDAFLIQKGKKRKKGKKSGYVLQIAVVTSHTFYKNHLKNQCIVLTLDFSENMDFHKATFSIKDTEVLSRYSFEEFADKHMSQANSWIEQFVDKFIPYAQKTCKVYEEYSSEYFVTCLMAVFSHHAKILFNLDVNQFGREHSPKDFQFRKQLSLAIQESTTNIRQRTQAA